MKDYYEILGVPADAELEAIRTAYRRLALEYHPDRGGSHEKMAPLNEAWEILSVPESRQRYDLARRSPGDNAAQAAAAADAREATQRAENYPRVWSGFVGAEYGRYEHWPTAGKSVSGWFFILLGGTVGALGGSVLVHRFVEVPGSLPYLFGAIVGAWLGQILHAKIGAGIRAVYRVKPVDEKTVIECPSCGKKLRVPVRRESLNVKCPRCAHEFSCGGHGSSCHHPEKQGAASVWLRVLVVVSTFLLVAAIALDIGLESSLPPELQAWVEQRQNVPEEVHPCLLLVGLVVVLGVFLAYVVGSIGLLRLQRWGAWAYTASIGALFLAAPFAGPTVIHAAADCVSSLWCTSAGMIIAMCFFTNALQNR